MDKIKKTNICRICLLEFVATSHTINKEIIELIFTCFSIKMNQMNEYPTEICNICMEKLNWIFEFRQLIEKSEIYLQKQTYVVLNNEELVTKYPTTSDEFVCEEESALKLIKIDEKLHYEIQVQELPKSPPSKPISRSEKTTCIVCNRKCTSTIKLNKHLVNYHFVRSDRNILKPFECDQCDKAYTALANLLQHKANHLGVKPFICEICQRGFTKKISLTSHMATHSGIRNYKCNDCERKFTSANILQQHKKTHSDVRPYQCSVCLKGFYSSNDLRKHFRTHTGEKPFLCSTCGRGFARITHLNIHLRIHSGERPHVCSTCKKGFTQSGDLKAHIRTHTGEKPYGCTMCPKRFNQSSGLSAHIKSHTGERNYFCEICHKSFIQSSSLSRHLKCHTTPVESLKLEKPQL